MLLGEAHNGSFPIDGRLQRSPAGYPGSSPNGQSVSTFVVQEPVEYYSTTKQSWVPTNVSSVHADGSIELRCKPGFKIDPPFWGLVRKVGASRESESAATFVVQEPVRTGSKVAASRESESAATFVVHEPVEYHSTTYQAWLATVISKVFADGSIEVECKPGRQIDPKSGHVRKIAKRSELEPSTMISVQKPLEYHSTANQSGCATNTSGLNGNGNIGVQRNPGFQTDRKIESMPKEAKSRESESSAMFVVQEPVEYYSTTYQAWLSTAVSAVHADGKIEVACKPCSVIDPKSGSVRKLAKVEPVKDNSTAQQSERATTISELQGNGSIQLQRNPGFKVDSQFESVRKVATGRESESSTRFVIKEPAEDNSSTQQSGRAPTISVFHGYGSIEVQCKPGLKIDAKPEPVHNVVISRGSELSATFVVQEPVEYYSTTRQSWLSTSISVVHSDGNIEVQCKPGFKIDPRWALVRKVAKGEQEKSAASTFCSHPSEGMPTSHSLMTPMSQPLPTTGQLSTNYPPTACQLPSHGYFQVRGTEMVIAVDIDDTLLQTVNSFKQWVDANTGRPVFPDWLAYQNAMHDYSSPWRQPWIQTGLISNVLPIPGAKEGLKTLKDAGFRLEAVTSRSEPLRDVTLRQLDALFPNMFSNVHLTGRPGPVLKGAVCRSNSARLLVDDSIGQLTDALKYGVRGILFDFQGTYGSTKDPPFGVTRLESWEVVAKWILANRNSLSTNDLRAA